MSSHQITLFHHGIAPNPPKVAILLEELGINYKLVKKVKSQSDSLFTDHAHLLKEFGDGENGVKAPDFLAINPNGRVPAIIDHTNNDKIVWESGAILIYLTERFDTSGKYTGKNLDEKAEVWEWLIFQVSGLGPMQGQISYFKRLHPVKNLDQSVYDRYINETYRIYGVLNKSLENRKWIALDRFTIADMSFYTWLYLAPLLELSFDEFPHLKAYKERIAKLPSVEIVYKKVQAED